MEAVGEAQPTGLATTGASSGYLAVSPDDQQLSWTTWDVTGNIWAVPLDSSLGAFTEPTPLTDITNARNTTPALSSDGRLAFVALRPGAPAAVFLFTPVTP